VSHLLNCLTSLPEPFKGKPIIASICAAYCYEMDHLQRALDEIEYFRDIEHADETRLKVLAERFRQPIITEDLEVLRKLVAARILVNQSDGSLRYQKYLHGFLYPAANATFYRVPPKLLFAVQGYDTYTDGVEDLVIARARNEAYVGLIEDAGDPSTSFRLYITPSAGRPMLYPATEQTALGGETLYDCSFPFEVSP
jgi:hypothetical protein